MVRSALVFLRSIGFLFLASLGAGGGCGSSKGLECGALAECCAGDMACMNVAGAANETECKASQVAYCNRKDSGVNPGGDTGVKPDGAGDASDAGKLDGYYAFGQGGATNRLIVFYADATADLCFMVRLTQRMNMSALTLPSNWDVENAGIFHAAAACTIFYTGQAEFLQALSMSGSMSWMGVALPKTIDTVDVTLNFAPSMWAPSTNDIKTTNLAVK